MNPSPAKISEQYRSKISLLGRLSVTIKTFKFLFSRINEHGIYVIEDTQTSYWAKMGGSSIDLDEKNTMMGIFKGLVDDLNYSEFEDRKSDIDYFDKHVVVIYLYHNLVFVKKGKNNEGSNMLTSHSRNAPWQ